MPCRVALLLGMVVVASACGGGGTPATVPTSGGGSPTFGVGKAVIDTDEGAVLLDVEMAATPEQLQYGLMHRRRLPEKTGMVFIFPEETNGGFYMKNTLIPLSIAFFDEDGKILRILDMEPCESDPCEIYEPEVSYRGALEVNQGAFERWGVEENDVIRVTQ